ncbi:MAG: DUF1553 domain-containing protein [Verrucomicrobiae bacterium]|nr:DUF1553 domain-containing protein [Verrucomicrobiae bacterium]
MFAFCSHPLTSHRHAVASAALTLALPLLGVFPASATPANKKALEKFFGPHLPANLQSCATCHVRAEPNGAESLEDFPHNAFGKALHALDGRIAGRIEAVLDVDSDGDGIANRVEILLGLPPGVPTQEGQVADLTLLDEKQKAFAAFHDRYPWRPFEPVLRPPVPEAGEGWARNEVDAFLAAEHVARGLSPRPEAPPEIWLRRVKLDLTGLAPTPDEIRGFRRAVTERPETAYEEVVDRLLESPQYGERWGRHWMDVWRYSDWSGYKDAVRASQPHIWRWRDWIIESLNADKGYDRMIVEMLAGDEIAPDDPDTLRATGYLVRDFHAGSRDVWLDNVVSHTAQGFLGITMGCAKCHDHKYDPIPTKEYYAMRAIFEGYDVRTDRIPGELDTTKTGLVRAYDKSIDPKTYLFDRGDERFPVKDHPISPAVPAILGGSYQPELVSLPLTAAKPWRRDFVLQELRAQREEAIAKAKSALAQKPDGEAEKTALAAAEAARKALECEFALEGREDDGLKPADRDWKVAAKEILQAQRDADLLKARAEKASAEQAKTDSETKLAAAKKKKDKAGESAATKALAAAKKDLATATKAVAAAEKAVGEPLTTKFKPRQATYPDRSNGRRLAFANWLADKANPLTARVAMNHLWLRHFGQAIVPTVNEFGGNGREPTHPALLDWLAAEFMDSGWSFKAMHRKIVLSAAYRMSGTPDESDLERDPDNLYLWRMPSRRMEGEIVRDNLLWIAGRLDPAMGGPEIDQNLAMESTRRSIYLRHAHEKLVEFVQIFDGPKVAECYQRVESVQPHQALAMHNSPLTQLAAEKLAAEWEAKSKGDPVAFLDEAFLAILGRSPKADELALCRQFVSSHESGSEATSPSRARERLVTVLLNHNDFVTIR